MKIKSQQWAAPRAAACESPNPSAGRPRSRTSPASERFAGRIVGILLGAWLGLWAALAPAQAGLTEQAITGLTNLYSGAAAWGDFDNDGRLDLVLTGLDANDIPVCLLYRNCGDDTFANPGVVLPGVYASAVAWGDYDNDGNLDLLLTGATSLDYPYEPITRIYRNLGGGMFANSGIVLPGVDSGAVAWGDYNNDGRLDFVLTGWGGGSRVSLIYSNTGDGTFTESGIPLTGGYDSAAAWGDYDGDGNLDLLLSGSSRSGPVTRIYRNNGEGALAAQTSAQLGVALPGVELGALAWGDYNNDGRLDFVLTGLDSDGQPVSLIYSNRGNGMFAESGIALTGVDSSSVGWGDYNNDGKLDLVLSGFAETCVSLLYTNNGDGAFAQSALPLTGLASGCAVWGDYNNDGRLDLLLAGFDPDYMPRSILYRNDETTSNRPPEVLTGLMHRVTGREAALSWAPGADDHTPTSGLHYNVRLETTNGSSRVVRLGNAGQTNTWTIKGLPEGAYRWSVQAVDTALQGGPFAPEDSFVVDLMPPVITDCPASRTIAGACQAALPDLTGEVAATDNLTASAHLVITQVPAPGAFVNPGPNNLVTFTVRDSTGNTAACQTLLTGADRTPPVFTSPTRLVAAPEPGQCEAAFTVPVAAWDECDPAPVVTCVPPFGAILPVGVTAVRCTAADASGNTTHCAFTVSVCPTARTTAGETWTPGPVYGDWSGVASSADGDRLVAAVYGGQIHTSADSGATWTPRESSRTWSAVASSADGTRLVAVVNGGQIHTSTDSGATWTPRESARYWSAVASSADGARLVAVVGGGQIYTSTDSAVTWTPRESDRPWSAVASSADGARLVAVVNGGQIYTSADFGATWTPRESDRSWSAVASSADGSKLVAAVVWGQIYTSTDSGVSWTARESNRYWSGVASSADGTRLVGAVYLESAGVLGRICTSTDSGVTWTPRESARYWSGVASSADGTRLLAGVISGPIYTSEGALIPSPLSFVGATNQVVAQGVPVTYNVTAAGACLPGVPVTCAPPSGHAFAVGATPVTCAAVDSCGVTNTAAFTVTVLAPVPPVLTCPPDLVLTAAPGQCDVTAAFTVTATDTTNPPPAVVCAPPSGARFPVGRTTVLCTATGASGAAASCAFNVSVYPVGLGAAGEIWAPGSVYGNWSAVASSADGVKLVAVAGSILMGTGRVVTSTNAGSQWTVRLGAGARYWSAVASSADGTKLVAAEEDGRIFTSANSGVTWTPGTVYETWSAVASSADGTKLVAVGGAGMMAVTGPIYTSTNSGANWTARASSRFWTAAASSADGAKLVAVEGSFDAGMPGQIHTSTNFGANWSPRETPRFWSAVASSADGTKLVATEAEGQIFTSTNSGVTWTPRPVYETWSAVASSADGTKLVASAGSLMMGVTGPIYTSTDSGATWILRPAYGFWSGVASSADGSKLVAAEEGGVVYTSAASYVALTNPPAILDATNLVLQAASGLGAVATFNVTATNLCQPSVFVICSPPSGSTFPLGTNTVTCVAGDGLGGTNTAAFTVAVLASAVTPPAFLSCSVAAPGEFRLQGIGTPGLTYTLQTSVNLVDWVDSTNLLASPSGLMERQDSMAPNAPACFYRLLWR